MPIVSLEYHDVVPDGRWDDSGFPGPAAASYKLSIERFRRHLEALGTATGIPVGANVHRVLAESSASVLLTFDDGGSSATVIAGLLAERGWCAHLFITTDQIGRPAFVSRDALNDLAKQHVVGSHSASHPTRMSQLSDAQLRDEWSRSIGELQSALGQRVSVASVPGGYYSRRVAIAAAAAGVEVLFTSEPLTGCVQVEGCSVLGRFTLRQHHDASYVARLIGKSPTARRAQWLQWNLKKAGKRLAGDAYLRVRDALFDRQAAR